jgi:hypothetical protein
MQLSAALLVSQQGCSLLRLTYRHITSLVKDGLFVEHKRGDITSVRDCIAVTWGLRRTLVARWRNQPLFVLALWVIGLGLQCSHLMAPLFALLLQGSMRHLVLVREVTAPRDKQAPSCRRATMPCVLVQIERDEQLLTFQSYMNRVRTPYEQSFSTNPLYYSLDVGPIHIIMLNSVRCCAAFASVLCKAQVWQRYCRWYHDLGSAFAPFDKCRRAHGNCHCQHARCMGAVGLQARYRTCTSCRRDLAVTWPCV